MASDKKIPTADTRSKDSRLSTPRNPETVKLPEEQNLVKDSAARFRTTTDIPSSADPRFADPSLADRLLSDRDQQIARPKTPQEIFEPSRIGPLLNGSLSTDPSLSSSDLGLSDPKYGDSFDENSRRRQPPPVSFNPSRLSGNNAGQIPLAPGVGNLPKAWQDLPKNFQDQLRRLLPIYYDITGPNGNLVDRDPFVPPNLFEDGEPNPNTEDFLSDRNEFIDFSQIELPNRSNINFLNLLLSLFNLVSSLSADDIKGDDYEVVVITKISDDEQRSERSESVDSTDSAWQATIREKKKEVDVKFDNDGNDISNEDQFPFVHPEDVTAGGRPIWTFKSRSDANGLAALRKDMFSVPFENPEKPGVGNVVLTRSNAEGGRIYVFFPNSNVTRWQSATLAEYEALGGGVTPETKALDNIVREPDNNEEAETNEITMISLGGRTIGDFSVGDPFPVTGSEVSVQEIETEEQEIAGEGKIEVAVKVILSNGEEILKA
jgi:hypothetical protein